MAAGWTFGDALYMVLLTVYTVGYREVRAIVLEELDYRAEADNAARIAANFEGRTDVNLQSEIDYFSDLQPVDQARLLAVFLHELTVEARTTYGALADQVHDAARLRFVNEIVCRLARFIE